jgi:hypothetical protein
LIPIFFFLALMMGDCEPGKLILFFTLSKIGTKLIHASPWINFKTTTEEEGKKKHNNDFALYSILLEPLSFSLFPFLSNPPNIPLRCYEDTSD